MGDNDKFQENTGRGNTAGPWKITVAVMAVVILVMGCVILGLVMRPFDQGKGGAGFPQTVNASEHGKLSDTEVSQVTDVSDGAGNSDSSGDILITGKKASGKTAGGSSDTGNKVKESVSKSESSPYVLTYSGDNSWNEGGATMRTLDLALTNNSGKPVKNWKLVIRIKKPVSVSGWNGTYTIKKGKKLVIKPADYNGELAAGSTIYLGCNLGTNGDLKIKWAKLKKKPVTVKGGTVDQDAINQGNQGSGNKGDNGNTGNSDNNGNTSNTGNLGNTGNSDNNGNTGNSGNNSNTGSSDVSAVLKRSKDAVQGDDWLHTDGRRILDKNGKEVWLTGLNWFGYNTGTNTFDGLWNSEMDSTIKAIADHGFNLIRVPISAQLINEWAAGKYPQANYNQAYNTALNDLNSLEIFDHFLTMAEACGIKVMMDIHSAETDASGHVVNLWYTDKVSLNQYYAALEWMAARYKNNDTIIAYDLKNEPHGKPNEGDKAAIWNNSKKTNNWKYIAEVAAGKVLAKNPNVLIMVEGTEIYPKKKGGDYSSTSSADYYFTWWGGNLRGVKEYPVNLGKYQDKLVYSPHDYGPTVYEQPWFKSGYDYDSLMKDCWKDNWFFIYEDNTAPLLIGEWGGFMKEPNLKWMTCMRTLITKYHLHHTFWCLNANSGDTGGLVLDDFVTWDTEKYNFVKKALWQENGKFVGLDHKIPLGDKGISLDKAKGL